MCTSLSCGDYCGQSLYTATSTWSFRRIQMLAGSTSRLTASFSNKNTMSTFVDWKESACPSILRTTTLQNATVPISTVLHSVIQPSHILCNTSKGWMQTTESCYCQLLK